MYANHLTRKIEMTKTEAKAAGKPNTAAYNTLLELMYSDRQMSFGKAKHNSLPRQCKECPFLFACHGECPKNRFAKTADGEPGLNYLCKGYRRFFAHVAPYMDWMKQELQHKRPPAAIVELLQKEPNHFD